MKEQIRKTLHRVTEEVLERLAFIFSFPAADRGVPAAGQGLLNRTEVITGCVSFEGPFTGTLAIAISRESLPELAGNMLGIDNSETRPEHQQDALRELLNVICGNLIAGKRAIFNVGTPRITDEAFEEEPVALAKLSLEVGECDIYLFITGEIPAENLAEAAEEAKPKRPDPDEWDDLSGMDIEDF